MSKLSINNSDLQEILDAVNALPEAGGGGGGSSVETCTVTIETNGPPAPGTPTFYYVNGSTITPRAITTGDSTLQVLKNSIMAITEWNGYSETTGSCNELRYGGAIAIYEILGDCIFTYNP